MPYKKKKKLCLNRTSLQPMTINANVSRRLVTVSVYKTTFEISNGAAI